MEEEKRISATFLGTVAEFYRDWERIFNAFDVILERYSQGEDIETSLKDFKSKNPRIFTLIDDIYHKEVELGDKLDQAKIGQDKRKKMLEFKEKFADLADEIDLLVIAELS
ncbi:MAG: hypothetical protein WAV32_09235 [Halobacteriota archaeon]